jgi:cyclohexadieny/prephenate dehydrogenase
METALRIGFVDKVCGDAGETARGADLVILCVPVGVCGDICRQIAPFLKPGAILTDAGSVKRQVIADCLPHVPEGVHFIPAHPMAGTEHSGPEAGFAELFEGKWCMLTPLPGTDRKMVEKLKAFWRACGSHVETMTAEHHDLVAAMTSHLPHLIAFNIVGAAEDLEGVTEGEVIKYAAGGFRDFTRIAASDPVMWRDIFLGNKEAVLEILEQFERDLKGLVDAIREDDGEYLYRRFARSRRIRQGILEMEKKAQSARGAKKTKKDKG